MTRTVLDILKTSVFDLALSRVNLLDERVLLISAAARIVEIDTEIIDFDIEIQSILDKVNSIEKTSVTLAEMLDKVRPPKSATPIPISIDPNQIEVIEAELEAAINSGEIK
jgi:hypothetical protein